MTPLLLRFSGYGLLPNEGNLDRNTYSLKK